MLAYLSGMNGSETAYRVTYCYRDGLEVLSYSELFLATPLISSILDIAGLPEGFYAIGTASCSMLSYICYGSLFNILNILRIIHFLALNILGARWTSCRTGMCKSHSDPVFSGLSRQCI